MPSKLKSVAADAMDERNVAAKKGAYMDGDEQNLEADYVPARLVHVAMQPFFWPVKTVRGACRHHKQEK